jgi:hypothetical protein
MEVLNGPDGKPSVVETDGDGHRHGRGGYGGGYGDSGWGYNDRAEFNARFFSTQDASGRQFAEAQVATAGVSKDVAVLSRDVVISEGRLLIQHCKSQEGIALLGKDMALLEARLNLEAAKNAAAAAECCCELKALIISESSKTRELSQSDKIRELELALAAAK